MKSSLKFSSRLEREQYAPKYPAAKTLVFFLLLAAGCVLSLILPLRPTFSESEKRELAKFPAFSLEALLDGSYFEAIDTWFSDTFPFRDQLVTVNGYVQSAYGLHPVEIHEQGGGNFDDDEIPDAPTRPADNTASTTGAPTTGSQPETTTPDITTQPESTTTAPSSKDTEPTAPPPSGEINTQDLGAILVYGDAGYEYYGFSTAAANSYIELVNRAAARLDGTATVYDLLIPTSMDIVLDDSVRQSAKSADQLKAIQYLYGSMDSRVKTIDLFDTLRAHRNEYLYFRTDHHWTATGAYYAYAQFCAAKGMTAPALESYQTKVFPGFLGSFYTKYKTPSLATNPDTVTAYLPPCRATMQFTDRSGATRGWPVISDVSGWASSGKYNTFIGGDNPLTVIQNQDRTDNSSCVVIKESYGNAFVPFLVADYQTVYVIDYRYYSGDLTEFVKENGIQDVLFVNNMSATRSSNLVGSMAKLVGQ